MAQGGERFVSVCFLAGSEPSFWFYSFPGVYLFYFYFFFPSFMIPRDNFRLERAKRRLGWFIGWVHFVPKQAVKDGWGMPYIRLKQDSS